jgi:hypothetical protein
MRWLRSRATELTLLDEHFMPTDKQILEAHSRLSIFQRKLNLNNCSQGALPDCQCWQV